MNKPLTLGSLFDGSGGFAFNIGFQVYINKGIINKLTGK